MAARRSTIRAGDVIDVRAGPCGDSRRGMVMMACPDQDPPVYEVAWADGTASRLYAADHLVTVVQPTELHAEQVGRPAQC